MISTAQQMSGVRYVEAGPEDATSAPTFLLLHGLGGSLHQWGEVQRRMENTCRTIAIDIPGFGQDGRPVGDFNVDSVSDQIGAFCRSFELRNCTLVSHSIGSTIAGLLAIKLADVFPRVILVDGTLFRASSIAQRPMVALRNPRLGAAVAAQFVGGMVPVSDRIRHLLSRSPVARRIALWPFVAHPSHIDPDILERSLEGTGSSATLKILLAAKSIDYAGIMNAISQPVSIIWGAGDRLIDHTDLSAMRRAANVVHEHEIGDCGHWPMVEKPAELVSFIKTWGSDATRDNFRDT